MSNFNCEYCGTNIIDSENGYITECEHWPIKINSCFDEAERRKTMVWINPETGECEDDLKWPKIETSEGTRESDGSVLEIAPMKVLLREFVRRCAPACKPGGWDYDKEMAELCQSASALLGDGNPWE